MPIKYIINPNNLKSSSVRIIGRSNKKTLSYVGATSATSVSTSGVPSSFNAIVRDVLSEMIDAMDYVYYANSVLNTLNASNRNLLSILISYMKMPPVGNEAITAFIDGLTWDYTDAKLNSFMTGFIKL